MQRVLQSYPKIYLACHTRHVRDDETGKSLSPRLGSILDHLDTQPPLTLSSLAKHLDVTQSTISLQIDKLQRAGYVLRLRDTQDRRRVSVVLTPRGKRIKEQNSVLDRDLVREMISLLRPGDVEAALSGLDLLAEAADKLMNRRRLRGRRKAR
ncbi:MAG TPA: MarR family transcriptional regulator [Terriglobales bacterium]|nr:MarR family transcriptional regulator [Terriglobales bacterium]